MTTLWVLLYLLAVALGTVAAYRRFNAQWGRRERARFVVGVLVVVLPALAGAVSGPLDAFTVLVVLGGFGVSGALTIALDIEGETSGAELIREALGD
jgi:MFS family permease